ncbi:MAG: endonuclease [Pseudonocardiales bacterium]|nr:endonuclease [Pseudonocardiales bacterium]
MDDSEHSLGPPSTASRFESVIPELVATDQELLTRLCELAAGIDIGTARMLALVGEVDAREAWGGPGIKSCAHWLSWKCGIGTVTARTHVRVARALRTLPLVQAEFNAGRLSYAKVRAVTRIADADNEEDLVTLAHASTAAQFERTVRAWRLVDDLAAGDVEHKREVRWHWDAEGMFVLRARLTSDEGAIVLAALAAVRIPENNTHSGASLALSGPDALREQQKAIPRDRDQEGFEPIADLVTPHADALVGLARSFLDPKGDVDRDPNVHVVVHVDSTVLTQEARGGLAAYESGRAISAATARRLACDSHLVAMLHADGDVLDVSKPTRRISRPIRRALTARDRGCAFPSCTETRHARLQAHHVKHWADGGETRISNLILLCRYHHRTIHLDGYRINFTASPGRLEFTTPDRSPLDARPGRPTVATGLPAADPSLIPAWQGEPLRLAFVISVLRDRRNVRARTRQKLADDQAAPASTTGPRKHMAA